MRGRSNERDWIHGVAKVDDTKEQCVPRAFPRYAVEREINYRNFVSMVADVSDQTLADASVTTYFKCGRVIGLQVGFGNSARFIQVLNDRQKTEQKHENDPEIL